MLFWFSLKVKNKYVIDKIRYIKIIVFMQLNLKIPVKSFEIYKSNQFFEITT